MIEFLDDELLLPAAKELIEQSTCIDLAIAYWGRGAIDKLGIDGLKPTRILCDLTSGGCNPNEIERLRSAPFKKHVKVRNLPGLHSKVYLSPTSIIVGSANASANGLGDEGILGTIEAAIRTNDLVTIDRTASWFATNWKKSRQVDAAMMSRARDAWLRRMSRPGPGETVLERQFSDPEWFRERAWLIHYVTEASQAAREKFEEVKGRYYSPHQLEKFGNEDLPILDLDIVDVPPVGDSIIDLLSNNNYKILHAEPYSKKHCAVLLRPTKDVQGLSLPRDQKRLLKNAIKAHLQGKDDDVGCNLQKLPDRAREYLAANFAPGRNGAPPSA
jgi:hypothetical protein